MLELHDIRSPAGGDSLLRSAGVKEPGRWRMSRRDCEFYSIMITSAGAFGRILVTDGKGRELFSQISTFTGSFVLGGFAEGGLVLELFSETLAPEVTMTWREEDKDIV